ncbi:transposase [Streptomyces sp. NRRL S-646]|uniref:transposase n=1 Tax=Streptomyces sp. NRRL S-646 TaxID=1463917 RepID=UPI000D13F29C
MSHARKPSPYHRRPSDRQDSRQRCRQHLTEPLQDRWRYWSALGLTESVAGESTVQQPPEAVTPRSYPPEFRRRVLHLVVSGRKAAEVAKLLGIIEQTIYVWRRRHLIDTGQAPVAPRTRSPDSRRPASGSQS